jgi:2-oxoglutarate ferredoxin oxidoreductase subunit alpha
VLTAEQLESIQKFSRYLDLDGDGVAARTLPGVHPKGAYFTRGSGHDKYGVYTEDADAYQEVVDRLTLKLRTAADAVPSPEIRPRDGAEAGIVALGGTHRAVLEAVDRLAAEGIALDYMRIRAFPFCDAVGDFLRAHERIFVVEQNRDGQLRSLLQLETGVAGDRLLSIRDYGGVPLSAKRVIEGVTAQLAEVAL